MPGTANLGSAGENIVHFNGVRLRVQGQGVLKSKLVSQDDIFSQDLRDLTMAEKTAFQPTLLANFSQQRAYYRLGTTERLEWFRINRIIIFSRELFSSYPQ